MTREEYAILLADLGAMYPRWSRLAASGAYSDRLYECFQTFDAVDAGETARQMRRADMEKRDPPINDLLTVLRNRTKTNRRAIARQHANDPTYEDRIEVQTIRRLCEADLATWTDLDVWKLYQYTQGSWQALSAWKDRKDRLHEPAPPPPMFFRGEFHRADDYERTALLGRLRAATLCRAATQPPAMAHAGQPSLGW